MTCLHCGNKMTHYRGLIKEEWFCEACESVEKIDKYLKESPYEKLSKGPEETSEQHSGEEVKIVMPEELDKKLKEELEKQIVSLDVSGRGDSDDCCDSIRYIRSWSFTGPFDIYGPG